MSRGSVKKNLGFQTIFQILNTCLPLITAPYLSRTLGAEQLGIFSFTLSVVAYFTLVAMLGTVNYGTRAIAEVKNDLDSRSKVFWEIYLLQLVVTFLCGCAYAVYIILICKENRFVALLQGISIVACLFDINWFFFGIEEFKLTVTRNIIIKFLTVVLILIFVKKEQDLWIYTLIMIGGTLLSQVVLLFYLPKYVSLKKIYYKELVKHIYPNLVLFIPLLAMSVYHTMDKTMLGIISTYEQSGFYYNSDKVVNIPLAVINGIGTVMLPRMSSLIHEGKREEANGLFVATLDGVAAISVALTCGIAAVSNEFIPFFYGKGYEPCILLTIVFSPILVIKSFSSIVRTQYLIPMNLEKVFIKSVIGGAIINLIFNFILIPVYGALGAVISTLLAELVACLFQFFFIRKEKLKFRELANHFIFYFSIGIMMIVIVRIVSCLASGLIMKLFIEILVGALFYLAICFLYWKKINSAFYGTIKGLFRRKNM